MTQVLIAGATGFVGSHLVTVCTQQGYEVRALVRSASYSDTAKPARLRASGATLSEGSLESFDSLASACDGMDVVKWAVGGGQIAQQTELLKAAKATSVRRFVPSDYGIDPKVSGAGSCVLFDQKALIHKAVKESGLNYTFVHSNGFFEYWVHSLGQVGLTAPPDEVQLYGDGTVQAALASVPDVARVIAATVDDPRTENKELHITANVHSQEELIQLWEGISGRTVKRVPVTLEALEGIISTSTTPDTVMNLIIAHLVRSVWIRGDATMRPSDVLEATALYPDIQFTRVRDALSQLV